MSTCHLHELWSWKHHTKEIPCSTSFNQLYSKWTLLLGVILNCISSAKFAITSLNCYKSALMQYWLCSVHVHIQVYMHTSLLLCTYVRMPCKSTYVVYKTFEYVYSRAHVLVVVTNVVIYMQAYNIHVHVHNIHVHVFIHVYQVLRFRYLCMSCIIIIGTFLRKEVVCKSYDLSFPMFRGYFLLICKNI